ncbi:MAG: MBL fold metallo-hydrolase [Planctomycetota bacterium]
MQVTYVGHACLRVEANGVSILMDPWLVDPAYCNSWFHYPPLVHSVADLTPVDYVYVSHEHPDHFDPATLEQFSRDQKILLPEFTSGVLRERFERMGFHNLVPMPFGERLELGEDLAITCFRSDLIWEDSAVVVESGGASLFNMNDCKLGDALLSEVGERYQPDIVFVPFSGAIHFPTCYDYDAPTREKLCRSRQQKHLDAFVDRVQMLKAKRAVPFAGNFAFLADDQLWMNEKGTNNINTPDQAIERLQERAPEIEPLQMNPGDGWTLEGGLARHQEPPDFGRKVEQVRAMAEEWRPKLQELRAAEKPARPGLRQHFESYFMDIVERHPELAPRINASIVFEGVGPEGGLWRLDYSSDGLKVVDHRDGDPWNVRISVPTSILQRVLDDEICWDEVVISFRCRFAENPEFFNEDFWAMLYNSTSKFLESYLHQTTPKYS